MPFRIDLRGCGVEGLGVGARETELGREGLINVNERCSALLKEREDMSGGDCGSAFGGILGVLRLKLGLPRSCFVLYMKVVKVANAGESLVADFKTMEGRGLN